MNHRIAMLTTLHPHDDIRIYHKESKALARAGWRVEIYNPRMEAAGEYGIRFRRLILPSTRTIRLLRGRSIAYNPARLSARYACGRTNAASDPLRTPSRPETDTRTGASAWSRCPGTHDATDRPNARRQPSKAPYNIGAWRYGSHAHVP